MAWQKKGLIYCPDGGMDWAQHSFMTPTNFQRDEKTIRLYGGLRDEHGVSRIGYIDLDANNPKNILKTSQKPVLDIGEPGMFDDNGVILGDVLRVKDRIYMYYVGFQIVQKVKFFAFTGLALSDDNGDSFHRIQRTPILDRTDRAPHIRAIHSVLYEDNVFKIWFAIGKGSGWQRIDGMDYPSYNIWYTESEDGIHFAREPILCIDTEGSEYRIGRPRVYKEDGVYKMFYTRDFIERNYIAGYAESADGMHWERKDEQFPLQKAGQGWDSEMLCYPVLHHYKDKTYMFYNGNGFGRTGVGYAELEKEKNNGN